MYIELKEQEDLFKVEVVYQNKKNDKLQEKLRMEQETLEDLQENIRDVKE